MARPLSRIVPTTTWHITHEEIVQFLTLKNAKCAAAGRPCPIAARVLASLESVGV